MTETRGATVMNAIVSLRTCLLTLAMASAGFVLKSHFHSEALARLGPRISGAIREAEAAIG